MAIFGVIDALRRGRRRRLVSAIAYVLAMGALSAPAGAEMQFGIYGGWGSSFDADVDISQPNGTNLTFSDVEFDDKSFTFDGGPPYYGLRAIYWREPATGWGMMVDYTHLKVKPDLSQSVATAGTRNGAAINGSLPMNQTVSLLEFTDGLNLLTFNILYRKKRDRFTPYGGVGVGLSIPNVEFRRANGGPETNEYQVTGVAVQGLVGVQMDVSDRFALFGEYKISYSQNEADLNGGGTLEADIVSNHLLFGAAYKFGHRAGPASYK